MDRLDKVFLAGGGREEEFIRARVEFESNQADRSAPNAGPQRSSTFRSMWLRPLEGQRGGM
jgi:hypothetical protein